MDTFQSALITAVKKLLNANVGVAKMVVNAAKVKTLSQLSNSPTPHHKEEEFLGVASSKGERPLVVNNSLLLEN